MRDETNLLRKFVKIFDRFKTYHKESDWLDYVDYMDLIRSTVKNKGWVITIENFEMNGQGFETLINYVRENYGPLQNDKMRFEVTDK